MKEVFCRAHSRIVAVIDTLLITKMPAQPLLTHRHTWLKAVEFYSVNIEAILKKKLFRHLLTLMIQLVYLR